MGLHWLDPRAPHSEEPCGRPPPHQKSRSSMGSGGCHSEQTREKPEKRNYYRVLLVSITIKLKGNFAMSVVESGHSSVNAGNLLSVSRRTSTDANLLSYFPSESQCWKEFVPRN